MVFHNFKACCLARRRRRQRVGRRDAARPNVAGRENRWVGDRQAGPELVRVISSSPCQACNPFFISRPEDARARPELSLDAMKSGRGNEKDRGLGDWH